MKTWYGDQGHVWFKFIPSLTKFFFGNGNNRLLKENGINVLGLSFVYYQSCSLAVN